MFWNCSKLLVWYSIAPNWTGTDAVPPQETLSWYLAKKEWNKKKHLSVDCSLPSSGDRARSSGICFFPPKFKQEKTPVTENTPVGTHVLTQTPFRKQTRNSQHKPRNYSFVHQKQQTKCLFHFSRVAESAGLLRQMAAGSLRSARLGKSASEHVRRGRIGRIVKIVWARLNKQSRMTFQSQKKTAPHRGASVATNQRNVQSVRAVQSSAKTN